MKCVAHNAPTKSRAAFTLIELLVVVAIIGILVALLGRTVFHGLAKGQEAACQNNLRQLAIGLILSIDGGKSYPVAQSGSESYFGSQGPLLEALAPHLRGASANYFCPRSVRLEKLDTKAELSAGRIGYFYWGWIAGGGTNGVSELRQGDSINVWLTQGWNPNLGQLVLLTDHFRDKQYWALPSDWQFHAPPDVEHSLAVPGTLAVMEDGSVQKIAPRP